MFSERKLLLLGDFSPLFFFLCSHALRLQISSQFKNTQALSVLAFLSVCQPCDSLAFHFRVCVGEASSNPAQDGMDGMVFSPRGVRTETKKDAQKLKLKPLQADKLMSAAVSPSPV